MDKRYTIQMSYEQLQEFHSYLMWSTTSYKDRTMLDLVTKTLKEAQLEADKVRMEDTYNDW